MSIARKYISIDWGTSNFRARIVNTHSLEISTTHTSNQGVKKVYDAYQNQTTLSQQDYFLKVLLGEISQLGDGASGLPIVTSGMASSSIGIKPLDYANFPIDADGTTLNYSSITFSGRELLIISGAKDAVGFMRGEEVQAIGLSEHLDQTNECVLILPGTHSKHLTYHDGKFQSMKNFMTGELFEVLANHSLLRHSVVKEKFTTAFKTAFLKGVDKGVKEKLSSILLDVRYEDLINQTKGEENYYYLSGMLIGNELAYLENDSCPIYLGATGPLHDLYGIALNHIITEERIHLIDQEEFRKATIKGQFKILKRHII